MVMSMERKELRSVQTRYQLLLHCTSLKEKTQKTMEQTMNKGKW